VLFGEEEIPASDGIAIYKPIMDSVTFYSFFILYAFRGMLFWDIREYFVV
jgi:hypothetical protein